MSMQNLKTLLEGNDQKILEELSLSETLSLEEAMCDAASPKFLLETADIPVNPDNIGEFRSNNEFDKYQFFNRDNVPGLSDDDLNDIVNPDHKNNSFDTLSEGFDSKLTYVARSVSDLVNADLNVACNDQPDLEEILTAGNTLRRPTSSKFSRITGVPMTVADVLSGNLRAADVVGEVNGDSTDQQAIQETTDVKVVVDYLLGEEIEGEEEQSGDDLDGEEDLDDEEAADLSLPDQDEDTLLQYLTKVEREEGL